MKQELVRLFLFLGDYARARQTLDQAQHLLQLLHFPAWETYITLLPAALLAYATGDYPQAQRDAEAAWQMAKQLYGSTEQADALVVRGLVMEQLSDPTAAAGSYQQALDRYDLLGLAHRAVEALAGLARLALRQDDFGSAQRHVDRILPLLAERTQVGLDEPFLIYLTCYKVLSVLQDQRAITLLTQGDQLLQRYADEIHDDALRRSFLEEVPIHRELRMLYTTLQPTLPPAEEPLATVPCFDGAIVALSTPTTLSAHPG